MLHLTLRGDGAFRVNTWFLARAFLLPLITNNREAAAGEKDKVMQEEREVRVCEYPNAMAAAVGSLGVQAPPCQPVRALSSIRRWSEEPGTPQKGSAQEPDSQPIVNTQRVPIRPFDWGPDVGCKIPNSTQFPAASWPKTLPRCASCPS